MMEAPPQSRRQVRSIASALFLAIAALYAPALRDQFIALDDNQYVTFNAHVQAGISLSGIKWAFSDMEGNWHPVTWISHMLDCQIYGLNPAGHHLTNVLLHAANAVLVFLFLWRATARL